MNDLTIPYIILKDNTMDLNKILKLGVQTFINSKGSGQAGSQLDPDQLTSALSALSGSRAGFDISSLLGRMQRIGMRSLMQSWLNDGRNTTISPDQINKLIGADKIEDFAAKLDLSEAQALGGLRVALPRMIDSASSDGALLDSIGGAQGLMKLASRFLGR